jgi:hypothetical protein
MGTVKPSCPTGGETGHGRKAEAHGVQANGGDRGPLTGQVPKEM